MSANKNYMVFSGTATTYLAEKICQSLGCPLGELQITKFSDGEFAVSYEESIRGRDIFLVQSWLLTFCRQLVLTVLSQWTCMQIRFKDSSMFLSTTYMHQT